MRYNPPPGWPVPGEGWKPPLDWSPDPSWPPAPDGWVFWLGSSAVAELESIFAAGAQPSQGAESDPALESGLAAESEPAGESGPAAASAAELASASRSRVGLRYVAVAVVAALIGFGAVSSLHDSGRPDSSRQKHTSVALAASSSPNSRPTAAALPQLTTSSTPSATTKPVASPTRRPKKSYVKPVTRPRAKPAPTTTTRGARPPRTPRRTPPRMPKPRFCQNVDPRHSPPWVVQFCSQWK